MLKWLKRKLITLLTDRLLAVVQEKYVLTEVKTSDRRSYYLLGGEKVSKEYLSRLKSDANILKDMEIWKIFEHTIRAQAHKAMFVKSENFEDVLAGKLMLYNLDVQRKIVDTLSEINLQSK